MHSADHKVPLCPTKVVCVHICRYAVSWATPWDPEWLSSEAVYNYITPGKYDMLRTLSLVSTNINPWLIASLPQQNLEFPRQTYGGRCHYLHVSPNQNGYPNNPSTSVDMRKMDDEFSKAYLQTSEQERSHYRVELQVNAWGFQLWQLCTHAVTSYKPVQRIVACM